MPLSVQATISEKATIQLLLANEIDISEKWTLSQSKRVLEALLTMDLTELVLIMDKNHRHEKSNAKNTPQFGSVDTLMKVPEIILDHSTGSVNYAQLGLALRKDPNLSIGALEKYGETHGKGTALLGLITNPKPGCFDVSALTEAFCQFNGNEKLEITERLCLRIPIIQQILSEASMERINGYSFMVEMTQKTKYRRGECIKHIFKTLEKKDCDELRNRIINIYWELDEEATNEHSI